MAYEIMMPQLSDSMEEGKLISWKVKEGEEVHKGDVIAEVESDKAIMEVQSFRNGRVGMIGVREGESVPVGTVIATIETGTNEIKSAEITETTKAPVKDEIEKKTKTPEALPKHEPLRKNDSQEPQRILEVREEESLQEHLLVTNDISHPVHANASAKARALAARYDIDIKGLQEQKKLPVPTHEKDIKAYMRKHYFTPKALKLLSEYHLDTSLFERNRKHDSAEILEYIRMHNIPLSKALDPFHKALIRSVENAVQKPVYHIYDRIDAESLQSHTMYSITVWLIRIFSQAMMRHETFRSTLGENGIQVWPNASIAVAMAHNDSLYMPVFKNADLMSPAQIDDVLKTYQQKVKNASMPMSDMQGSTFGISNLGMMGIERFDAMINQQDSGIAAIGAAIDGKISITLTLDHRLINGYQAAEFMQTVKTLAVDLTLFKEF